MGFYNLEKVIETLTSFSLICIIFCDLISAKFGTNNLYFTAVFYAVHCLYERYQQNVHGAPGYSALAQSRSEGAIIQRKLYLFVSQKCDSCVSCFPWYTNVYC